MGERRVIAAVLLAAILAAGPLTVLSTSTGRGATAGGFPAAASTGPLWSNVTTPPMPSTLAGAMMAYSTHANRFVLFGGWDGEGENQTWVYDPANRSWSQVVTGVAPSTRGDAQFTYDPHDDVFLLFGGWHEDANGSYVRLADTWAFSLARRAWWNLSPSTAPAPRSDAAVAFDTRENTALVFGGFNGTAYLGDAWSYSYAANLWSPRPTTAMPSARADGRMAYDPRDDVFLLYGGNDYSDPSLNFHHLADTWEYSWNSNVWTLIAAKGSPGPRDYAVLAYDSGAGALLLFGGYGNRTTLGDTWAYDVANATWLEVPGTPSPPPRFAAVGGYDPGDDLFVVFGGLGPGGLRADTWILTRFVLLSEPTNPNPDDPLLAAALVGFGVVFAAAGFQVHRRTARPREHSREPEESAETAPLAPGRSR